MEVVVINHLELLKVSTAVDVNMYYLFNEQAVRTDIFHLKEMPILAEDLARVVGAHCRAGRLGVDYVDRS